MDYTKEARHYQQEVSTYLAKVRQGRRVAAADPMDPRFSEEAERTRQLKPLGIRAPAPHETFLTPDEERQYKTWKQKYAPHDSGEDYDFRGAFKAGLTPGPENHWADTYKKPNHPTFSDQSIYSSLTGTKPGTWRGETFVPFTPKKTSMNDPLETLTSGLRALELNTGFDVTEHHQKMLTTGPFADAMKRQSVLHPELAQVGFGGGGNTAARQQLKTLEQEDIELGITPPAPVPMIKKSQAPIASADAAEKLRLQRVAEQDAIERKLGIGVKPVETEDEHLKRLGLK